MKRFICTLFGLLAGMALLLPSLSWAKYPEKPITFICPYGAGGSTDIQARVLAGSLEKKLNQPIIVKNITGAGGLPGTQAAIDARPDGYTFGYIPLGPLVMQPHLRGLPSQVDQFAYVARIINAPYVLFVAANAPWNSFEAMMKGHPCQSKEIPLRIFWCGYAAPYRYGRPLLPVWRVRAACCLS